MLKKPLVIATISAALATATLSTPASAGDPLLGALIGGGIGAAIGNGVSGHRDARIAGGVLGALVGSSIASSGGYYDDGYYGSSYGPAYAPSYGYPAPVYYGAPAVVIRSYPRYQPVYNYRYRSYDRYDHRRDWRR